MTTLGKSITSFRLQRQIASSSEGVARSLENLSTGKRINKPSDDPAGLAAADMLGLESKLLSQAVRNANDGISALNIMDASLASQGSILSRMQELAEQAASGVLDDNQRRALDDEYQSLISEFDRVAETTEFNGTNLLKSPDQTISLAVGTDSSADSIIEFSTVNSHSTSGVLGLRSDFSGSGFVDVTDLNRYGTVITPLANGERRAEHQSAAMVLNVVDSNGDNREIMAHLYSLTNDMGAGFPPYPDITLVDVYLTDVDSGSATNDFGQDIQNVFSKTFTFLDNGATAEVSLDFSDLVFEHIDTASTTFDPLGYVTSHPVRETAIGYTNLRHAAYAEDALAATINRAEDLSALRADLGAIQSRLSSTIEVNRQVSLAKKEAESAIRDVDVADEVANLVQAQILQQTATALFGQANQSQGIVLDLLRA